MPVTFKQTPSLLRDYTEFTAQDGGATYRVVFTPQGEARAFRNLTTDRSAVASWRRLPKGGPTARKLALAIAEALAASDRPDAALWAGVAFRYA